jgi:hypothetical protein
MFAKAEGPEAAIGGGLSYFGNATAAVAERGVPPVERSPMPLVPCTAHKISARLPRNASILSPPGLPFSAAIHRRMLKGI